MKRTFVALFAALATVFGLTPVHANNYFSGGHGDCVVAGCDAACPSCCDDLCNGCGYGYDCCTTGGIYAEAEALFFRYNRADGNRVGTDAPFDDVDFGHHIAPRLTVGYVGPSGFGARVRYFQYDQTRPTLDGFGSLGIDTYTIDVEGFERFSLNNVWDLEVSGGVRYTGFDETMVDGFDDETRFNRFYGWGGIVGLTASRNIGQWGGVFGRLRQAILVDDKLVQNQLGGFTEQVRLRDSIVGMTEIAAGYEYNRVLRSGSLVTFRAGYEWQLWHNFSSSFAGPVDPIGGIGESVFTGPSDVGFDGFTLSIAFQR